jgi:prevent-host-death family protein
VPKKPSVTARRTPREWSLQDAKNKLSEVVDAAAQGQPQLVTRRGVKTAVVISYQDYTRVAAIVEEPRPSFEAFLLSIPKAAPDDGDVEFERIPLVPRDVDF